MALAERSKDDIVRLQANTAHYQKAVEAWNNVPVLETTALKKMIAAAAATATPKSPKDKKPK